MSVANSVPAKMNLSFSGCGFLCVYHCGAAAAIKEHAPYLTENKVSGASAGAIIATGLVCNICISQATSIILKVVSQARANIGGPMSLSFDLMGIVHTELLKILPEDAYKRCTNRVQISLTRYKDMKNVVVSQFDSNKDLIEAILCSCFIPGYAGYSFPTYQGVEYFDGGFTDNQPKLDKHTVTVSPFAGESDICPPDFDSSSFLGIDFSNTSIRCTTRNLFRLTACLAPANLDDCAKMCLQGYEDATRFLVKNGMTPCIRCLCTTQDAVLQESSDPDSRLSPPARLRKASSSNIISRRKEQECESEHMYNTRVTEIFPAHLREKFDQAAAAEKPSYLDSFLVVRYTRTWFGLAKLPLELMLFVAQRLSIWLASAVIPEGLRKSLYNLVTFIFSQMRSTGWSLLPSLFCSQSRTVQVAEPPQVQRQSHFNRESCVMSDQEKLDQALSLATEKRRKYKREGILGARVASEWTNEAAELDSTKDVLEFTKKHDAAYEFHFQDAQHKVHRTFIFNMEKPEHLHDLRECTTCHRVHSDDELTKVPRKVSTLFEEDEDSPVGSSQRDNEDSGLSVGECRTKQTSPLRDACCSPVQELSGQRANPPPALPPGCSPMVKLRSKTGTAQAKRPSSAGTSASPSMRRAGHLLLPRDVLSSDSDADLGERLFVPKERRERTFSKEYDGEPEQSDDQGN